MAGLSIEAVASTQPKKGGKMSEIERLKEELDGYKSRCKQYEELLNSQRDTIDKYHKIFMLQDAELKKLRGESA